MFGLALALNARTVLQGTTDAGTGIEVQGAKVINVLIPKGTTASLKGSSDAGVTFGAILGSAMVGSATDVIVISLMNCRFDHVRAVFAGAGALAVLVADKQRVAPPMDINRALNKVIEDPILGTP